MFYEYIGEWQVDVKQLSSQNYYEGFNCAESVVRAFRDSLNLDISGDVLRMDSDLAEA